jgi:hypothetical protein
MQINYDNPLSGGKAGCSGTISTTEPDNIVAMVLEPTSADLPFGFGASRGVGDRTCKKYDAAGKFAGFAVVERGLPSSQYDAVNGWNFYKGGQCVSLMKAGTLWAKVKTAVAAGDPVHCDAAGQAQTGAGTLIVGAEFLTSSAANGMAEIRLNSN